GRRSDAEGHEIEVRQRLRRQRRRGGGAVRAGRRRDRLHEEARREAQRSRVPQTLLRQIRARTDAGHNRPARRPSRADGAGAAAARARAGDRRLGRPERTLRLPRAVQRRHALGIAAGRIVRGEAAVILALGFAGVFLVLWGIFSLTLPALRHGGRLVSAVVARNMRDYVPIAILVVAGAALTAWSG